MKESYIRHRLVKLLQPLHAISVEAFSLNGVPDVHTTRGWIEIKRKDYWPMRPTTPVRVEHYTPLQRAFAVAEVTGGGAVYLLLVIGEGRTADWVFLPGAWAAVHLGSTPKDQVLAAAFFHSQGPPPTDALISALTQEFRKSTGGSL